MDGTEFLAALLILHFVAFIGFAICAVIERFDRVAEFFDRWLRPL